MAKTTKEILSYMQGKLESIHEDIHEIKEHKKKQNGRIEKLERNHSFIRGIGVVGVLLIGGLLKYIYNLIHN